MSKNNIESTRIIKLLRLNDAFPMNLEDTVPQSQIN